MDNWKLYVLVALLIVGCCWLTREAFPKVITASQPSDTTHHIDTLWQPATVILDSTGRTELVKKIFKSEQEKKLWLHRADSLQNLFFGAMDSYASIVAKLDSVVNEDSLHLKYWVIENIWDIRITHPPRFIDTLIINKPYQVKVEESYPWYNKALYYLAGFGTSSVINSLKK
jgi:hypothetical protein